VDHNGDTRPGGGRRGKRLEITHASPPINCSSVESRTLTLRRRLVLTYRYCLLKKGGGRGKEHYGTIFIEFKTNRRAR
jgi:hypothetical protein